MAQVAGKEEQYQKDLRRKLNDLSESLSLSNNGWNAWELEFIEDISLKLQESTIHVTPKQLDKIWDLWEKI